MEDLQREVDNFLQVTELISCSWKQIQVSHLLALDCFAPEATAPIILKPYVKWLFLTGLSSLILNVTGPGQEHFLCGRKLQEPNHM